MTMVRMGDRGTGESPSRTAGHTSGTHARIPHV